MEQTYYTSLAELQARPLPPEFYTITGPLPYTLLNDLMFRIVFEANQEALKALLCSLLHYAEDEILEIEIKNPIKLGKRVTDKEYIYDIYLLLNNRKRVHLELQVAEQSYWADRSVCYLCRDFGELNAGDTYDTIKPLIQIDILDFDLYENTHEFYSTYHLSNDKTGRIYNDKLTLHVLQLGKEEFATQEDRDYRIDYWSRLFKATTWEELRMLAQSQSELQTTIETIYQANADDNVRAELRAREEELRVKRTLDNEIKRQTKAIEMQQQTLEKQATTITEQKNTIAAQKNTIDEQQSTIDTQQSIIDKLLAENARLKQHNDNKPLSE